MDTIAPILVVQVRTAREACHADISDDVALTHAERAVELAPGQGMAHYRRGWVLFHAGQLDEALEAESEARVGNRSISAQIQVPLIRLGWQPVLGQFALEEFRIMDALPAARRPRSLPG